MLSIENSFEGITRVFKELSSIVHKISWFVGELHENRRFFENKRLFLKETLMFLWCACRVQRMLSIVLRSGIPMCCDESRYLFLLNGAIILKYVSARRTLLVAVSSSNPSG